MQVLWFAPTKCMEEDNFYGNVSFVIKWKDVLHQFGPNIYLIDQAIYKRNSFTRILLTPKRYYQLTLMSGKELADNGACMTKNLNNCYQHVSECYCKESFGPHELQIGIEVSDDDARWLFRNCSALPNSHTLVNVRNYSNNNRGGVKKMYESYRCYRYNTALNTPCPYPFNLQETERKIHELNLRGKQNGQSENPDSECNTHLLPSQIMFNTFLNSHDTENRIETDNRFNTEPTERRTVENYSEISSYHRTSVRNEPSMYDWSSNNTRHDELMFPHESRSSHQRNSSTDESNYSNDSSIIDVAFAPQELPYSPSRSSENQQNSIAHLDEWRFVSDEISPDTDENESSRSLCSNSENEGREPRSFWSFLFCCSR